ncbi:hypothetical protein ACX3O0_14660 [Homoserinimonas sp. A447]
MGWYYLMVWGSVLAGVALALVWWLILGRKTRFPGGSVAAFSLAAGILLVLGAIAPRTLGLPLLPLELPLEFWLWYTDYRFIFPLVLAVLGTVLLAVPVRARKGRGVAELTPRTPLSFARGWWFVVPAVVLAIILALTIAAGAASQPDPETGHYTMYVVDLGGERSMGTSIYGWFSSVPALILTAVMIMVAAFTLFLIARPPLDHHQERDVHIRTLRTRNVVAVGTGALLVHLGTILGSLAGTASLRGAFSTSEGSMMSWTAFAALEPTLRVASYVAASLGIAFWVAVALSAIPNRRRASTSST